MTTRASKLRLIKWLLVWGVILPLLLVVIAASFVLWHRPAPGEVTLTGSAAELGTMYGRKFKVEMRLLSRVYLDGIVCRNSPQLIEVNRARALKEFEAWPADYRMEIQAIADATSIPVGALAYANSFLDLGVAKGACRSTIISSTNIFLHAHNLDWDNLGGLGKWTVSIIRRKPTDGRLSTVSVGFPGLTGALDIINEKGLALSFNQLAGGRGVASEPVFIMMRRIAERCSSLDEARHEITNAVPGMSFIITVSDAVGARGSVFERLSDEVTERPLNNGWVAACNASQGTNSGRTPLDKVLASRAITGPEDLQAVLRGQSVLLGCNIYSVIFDFRGNRLLLASGQIPAAEGNYRRFALFPKAN